MDFVSRYVSHQPDAQGQVNYMPEEHRVWQILYARQIALLPGRACEEFIHGLSVLKLSADNIPQLPDVSDTLRQLTGWEVAPVRALISARAFFELLANRQFPAATFIRSYEELDYVQEPDIFHELFGHCPLLTHPVYAEFMYRYALKVLSFDEQYWPLLQRFFWFTVEFGLIKTEQGMRAYGGGILSSIAETPYSVDSDLPLRVLFNPLAIFRMPYRIDEMQRVYFFIENFETLFEFIEKDLHVFLLEAKQAGEYLPLFPVDPGNPAIHILAC